MQILALIDTFRVGGPGKQLISFCKAASAYGMTVRIGTFLRRPHRSSPFIEACRSEGITVRVYEEQFLFDPRPISLVRSDLFESDIDLFQTHSYKASIVGALFSSRMRREGIRWVAYMHGFTNENLKIRLYYELELLAIRRADAVLPVSESIARIVKSHLGQSRVRMEVIQNALLPETVLDRRTRTQVRQEMNIAKDATVIGVIGRLSREKGQGIFIDALARLDNRNVCAVLVGEGPDESELVAQVKRIGWGPRILFMGYQENMEAIYAGIDLVVIPSLNEGIPNVALEAMGRGIPLIASAVGGLPDMVADQKSGLLVPPGDANALACAIRFLLDHPEERQRIGEAGRATVETRFSMALRMKRIGTLYEGLVTPKGDPHG